MKSALLSQICDSHKRTLIKERKACAKGEGKNVCDTIVQECCDFLQGSDKEKRLYTNINRR